MSYKIKKKCLSESEIPSIKKEERKRKRIRIKLQLLISLKNRNSKHTVVQHKTPQEFAIACLAGPWKIKLWMFIYIVYIHCPSSCRLVLEIINAKPKNLLRIKPFAMIVIPVCCKWGPLFNYLFISSSNMMIYVCNVIDCDLHPPQRPGQAIWLRNVIRSNRSFPMLISLPVNRPDSFSSVRIRHSWYSFFETSKPFWIRRCNLRKILYVKIYFERFCMRKFS